MKLRRRSKTFWFGISLMCLSVVEAHSDVFGEYQSLMLMIIGIVSILLREVTTEPLAPLIDAKTKR